MRSRLAGPSFFTSRPTPSDVYGMLPSDRTSPLGSATPTTSLSESTSSPTCRISFSIDRLLSLVALRYGQADRSVTYELAIGAGRPIVTIQLPPSPHGVRHRGGHDHRPGHQALGRLLGAGLGEAAREHGDDEHAQERAH